MLHSVPLVAPAAPCLTRGRAARGPFTIGYSAFGSGDGRSVRHRLLPLNFPTLIVDFGSGQALLTGARARGTVEGPTAWARGVSIGLTPSGVSAFFGLPMSEISGQLVPVTLPWAEHLAALPSWPARFAQLDAIFASPGCAHHGPAPQVTDAWWRLQRTPGRVADVARQLGVGRRRLEQDFRREIGLSPGTVARIARLQRAVARLARGDAPLPAAVAGGYADQAHLTRTMRDMIGLTPAAFRAFVQDCRPARP
jgi:AraC-like DNA-binding protein